mgnify:CR=1 FL=1
MRPPMYTYWQVGLYMLLMHASVTHLSGSLALLDVLGLAHSQGADSRGQLRHRVVPLRHSAIRVVGRLQRVEVWKLWLSKHRDLHKAEKQQQQAVQAC